MKATFAAGCFWGVEELFQKVKGVKSTCVGYTGGTFKDPTYEDVCSGKTGHAEAIQMEYNPSETSYENLLMIFWDNHDPTTLNQQGPDIGEQYRSVVFFHTPEQEVAAKAMKEKLQDASLNKFNKKIVTQIITASQFYKAEDYHQQYLQKRGLAHCNF
ncbi:MAG: peptide methionine sulfoxide reductase MsrA [Marine Group I thaumarchaeote]|nr:MAG: peptide methionine sulfoxide reductase MsrA [Marine Group I thaumarchaeote]